MSCMILGYYGFEDGFYYGGIELKKYGFTDFYFFPGLLWVHEKLPENPDYLKKFNNLNIDLLIIWYSGIEANILKNFLNKMSSKNVIFKKKIIYNWDPVLYNSNIKHWNQIIHNVYQQIPLIDKYYCVTASQIIDLKKKYGNDKCDFLPPGFNKELAIEKIIKNQITPNVDSIIESIRSDDFICDVSFVITNLYDNPIYPPKFQNYSRKKLLDIFYQHRNRFKVHLYGTPNLKKLYPEIYKGFVKYNDCPEIFLRSKVNICLNIFNCLSNNDYEYYSERLPQILGYGGLLVTDYDYKCLEKDIDYIYLTENTLHKIKNCILYPNNYIEMRKNGCRKAWENMGWEKWADQISNFSQKN